jgi:hypothetical protein
MWNPQKQKNFISLIFIFSLITFNLNLKAETTNSTIEINDNLKKCISADQENILEMNYCNLIPDVDMSKLKNSLNNRLEAYRNLDTKVIKNDLQISGTWLFASGASMWAKIWFFGLDDSTDIDWFDGLDNAKSPKWVRHFVTKIQKQTLPAIFRFLPKLATGLLIVGGTLDGASLLIPTDAEAGTITDVLSDPEQCLEFLLWQPQNIDYAFKMSEHNPKIRQNLILLSTVLQAIPRNQIQ